MDWLQVLTILGSTGGLFFWARTEAKSDRESNATDRRLMQASIEANRKEITALIESNRKETCCILEAIKDEIKDFHGRLCSIEAARK